MIPWGMIPWIRRAVARELRRPSSFADMDHQDGWEDFNAAEWSASFPLDDAAEPAASYAHAPRRNALVEETFELALMILHYCERLRSINPVFADQILRSGTSPGSQAREAQQAESAADFIHKLKIGFKELEETDFRLTLCHRMAHYPHNEELVARVRRLFPLFNSIIHTTRLRIKQQRRK